MDSPPITEEKEEEAGALYGPPNVPEYLWKAFIDTFSYALALRSGVVFYFSRAEWASPDHEWVRLREIGGHSAHIPNAVTNSAAPGFPPNTFFNFERGVDVRLSEIAWVADAPFGS